MMASMVPSPDAGDADPADIVLLDLARRLGREETAEAMYAAVDEAIGRLVRFDRIAIGTIGATTRRLTLEYERGMSLGLPDRYESLPPDLYSLIHPVVEQGEAVLHTVLADRDVYRGDAMRRRGGVEQALVTPMVARGSVIGLVMLNTTKAGAFTRDTVTLVETVSRMLGLALAAQHEAAATTPSTPGQVFAETTASMALAENVDQVLAQLYDGVGRATGASVLRFWRREDGAYRFEEARVRDDLPGLSMEIDEIADLLAARLPDLIETDIGSAAIPQRAIFTDRPLADRTVARVRGLDALGDLCPAAAVAITPLHAAREVLGALVAVWPESTPTERISGSARSLFGFGDLAGPAIHRLILLERLEQRVAEIETIRRLTDSIARTPRLQEAFDIICRTSQLITGLDFVAVLETTADHVVWRSASGARDPGFLHKRIPVPHHVIRRILQRGQEVVLEDIRLDPDFKPDVMPVHTSEGLRSTVVVPVYVNARLRAAMVFASRRLRTYGHQELTSFHALAATAATAVASNDARMREPEEV